MFGLQSSDLILVDANNRQVRPAGNGTSVALGASNAKGAWTQLIASAADDFHWVEVIFNGDTGASRAKLMDIGIGGAGAETVWIPDLVAGPVSVYQSAGVTVGGCRYVFPLKGKAGTRLSSRGQVNNATAGTCNVVVRLFKARHPDRLRTGSRVIAIGIDSANSRGQAITEGTAADGTYTELGSIPAGARPWFWNLGVTYDAATKSAKAHCADLAIGVAADTTTANKRMLVEDYPIAATTTPQISHPVPGAAWGLGLPGESLYGRQQDSGAAETGFYHAAYGVI